MPDNPVKNTQAVAADAVAAALAKSDDIQKVSLFIGSTLTLINGYLETDNAYVRLRIEVHTEGI